MTNFAKRDSFAASMLVVLACMMYTASGASNNCIQAAAIGDHCGLTDKSRGSSLVQTWHERSEVVVTDADNRDGAFCCFYGRDENNVCGTCKSPHLSDSYCGRSERNCKACGRHGTWCSSVEPNSAPPSPTPTPPLSAQHSFCCFWAPSNLDICGTCTNLAASSNYCGESEENCKACGSHHTWCDHVAAGSGLATSPTSVPTLRPTVSPTMMQTAVPTSETTAVPTNQPTPAPTIEASPEPTPEGTPVSTLEPSTSTPTSDTVSDWSGTNMKLTHYWDCSGQGCDAATLQPWDPSKFISPPGYAPQDPAEFGGAIYGEKMWLTGAASDALSELMGDDDPCCGMDQNDGGVGGCGKCVLVQNPASLHPDWTAVMMKKNRCPPWSNGCGAGEPHFDVAAPGFDNLQYSTANVCGERAGTGFGTRQQSAVVGSWYHSCANTADCSNLCDELPISFQKGCKLFASWGWTRGDPDQVKFKAVACPEKFVERVGSLFGANGATSV